MNVSLSLASSMESLLPAPVLIVEDEPLTRSRLENILRQLGYGADSLVLAGSLTEARERLAQDPMALALVDLGLPDGNGVDLIAEMRAADPMMGILVISAWSTDDAILNSLRAGATGYVLKERDDLEVSLSIRSVLRGGAPIDPFLARRIIKFLQIPAQSPAASEPSEAPSLIKELSQREQQILELVAEGFTNREIGEKLSISHYTVDCHIKRIYRKLAVSSRVRAISTARRHGLI